MYQLRGYIGLSWVLALPFGSFTFVAPHTFTRWQFYYFLFFGQAYRFSAARYIFATKSGVPGFKCEAFTVFVFRDGQLVPTFTVNFFGLRLFSFYLIETDNFAIFSTLRPSGLRAPRLNHKQQSMVWPSFVTVFFVRSNRSRIAKNGSDPGYILCTNKTTALQTISTKKIAQGAKRGEYTSRVTTCWIHL